MHAVTEGTDAQATVSGAAGARTGETVTGQASDTDTIVASTRAYVHALNRLKVRRQTTPRRAWRCEPAELNLPG